MERIQIIYPSFRQQLICFVFALAFRPTKFIIQYKLGHVMSYMSGVICRIGHDSTGIFGSSWFLYSVQVTNLSSDRSWYFPFKQWITKELSSDEDPETEIFPGEKLKGTAK